MKRACILSILLLCLASHLWAASLGDIHPERLPKDPKIAKALNSIQPLELFVQLYPIRWGGPISKDKARGKLESAMKELEEARNKYPDNEELALVSGLVASYAFNLDVNNSWNVIPEALDAASKLDPTDIRPKWFLGNHNCQVAELAVQGMEALLAIDNGASSDLPETFWFDEMLCATTTNMPAHAQRAAAHLAKSGHKTVVAILSKDKGRASAEIQYSPDQLWLSVPTADGIVYRNYACGITMTVPADWKAKLSEITDGKCAATFTLPPIKGVDGSWTPNIVLIAYAEQPGDSFEEYVARLEGTRGSNQPDATLATLCPVQTCRTAHRFDPGTYPTGGGGHGLLIQFERSQPQQSGLALETPVSSTEQNRTVADYYARFPGNIYYAFLLDSATSILPEAQKEFAAFMKTVRVD